MVSSLIGLHAGLGELGLAMFLWVFVELISPSEKRIARARIAAIIGTFLFFVSWFAGGYYYINTYGSDVKPIIQSGPEPWAHSVFMETKEHIFLFIPFLSFLTTNLLYRSSKYLLKDKHFRNSVFWIIWTILILGGFIGLMGYLISTGARSALEAGV